MSCCRLIHYLILTVSGSVKVWEFSSGQEIKSFLPEDSSKEEDHSVVAIACLASADEKVLVSYASN